MSITKTSPKYFLGAKIPNVKVLSKKIDEIITALNDITDGNITTADLTVTDSLSVGGNTEVTGKLVTGVVTENHTASAINATATATAAQLATGLVTSTSASATSITFPTATSLLTAIEGAVGTEFTLIVDNSAGANTVTMIASATITAATAVVTGGATLTIASGATGIFKIYFPSLTTAKVYRVG